MDAPDGRRYRCSWIEDSVTIHSDGNVSCGLDDPHSQRSFGNLHHSRSIEEVFRNPEYLALQDRLWEGYRCRDCGHFREVAEEGAPPPAVRQKLPTRLVLETTVKCNIRCPNPPCLANNDASVRTRDQDGLTLEAVHRVAGELGENLQTILFYNYGEPFMNRAAESMLAALREKAPAAKIVTSTNGILLADPARAEKVVAAVPDHVTFTISGVTQESYGRYHVRGQLVKAMKGLKNVCDAKRVRCQAVPHVLWRYLVFNWNDSDAEIDQAVATAEEYGVDELSLYLTNTPVGVRSLRFSPGSPAFLKYRRYIHRDAEGRLDHEYHCELPDEDGLFKIEELPSLGTARWTSSRASISCGGGPRWLRIAISTARSKSAVERHTCQVRTPWATVTVPVVFGEWQEASFWIPAAFWDVKSF